MTTSTTNDDGKLRCLCAVSATKVDPHIPHFTVLRSKCTKISIWMLKTLEDKRQYNKQHKCGENVLNKTVFFKELWGRVDK